MILNKNTETVRNIAESLLNNSFVLQFLIPHNYKKFTAFTLAEVLIALLIIGVISSLTIPALIQYTQDLEFKVAYKKAFAVASNTTKQAISNGLFIPRNAEYDVAASLYNFNIFKNQFVVTKECINNNNEQCWNPNGEQACDGACGGNQPTSSEKAFIDGSGMAWSMSSVVDNDILVDTNGNKGPNRYGKDRWWLKFADHQNNRITVGLLYKIGPYYDNDVIVADNMACHYPPCYYIKWLKE